MLYLLAFILLLVAGLALTIYCVLELMKEGTISGKALKGAGAFIGIAMIIVGGGGASRNIK